MRVVSFDLLEERNPAKLNKHHLKPVNNTYVCL